jgi:hypothetical protein
MNNEVCVYAFREWVRYLEFRETPTKQGGARQSGFASPIVPKYHQHIVLSSSIVALLIRLNLNFIGLDYFRELRILLLRPASARDFSEFIGDQGDSEGHLASQLMNTVLQRPGYEPRYIRHLPPRLRMRGCISPLPQTQLWRAQRLYFALLHLTRSANF